MNLASLALQGKGLAIAGAVAGVALLAVAAWGGLGWHLKATAERDFAEYQRAAAETITAELLNRQAAAERQQALARQASENYQKGAAHVRQKTQPALDELVTLRTLWAARDPASLRQPAEAGGSALPTPPDPAGGPDARACTDRPGALVEAAAGIAQDLAACALEIERLKGLQEWARGLSTR